MQVHGINGLVSHVMQWFKREIMAAEPRVIAIDTKRSRQIETCLGSRVKKLVVNCM